MSTSSHYNWDDDECPTGLVACPTPSSEDRNISGGSISVVSGLSCNSHLDFNDTRRMTMSPLPSGSTTAQHRKIETLIDQCLGQRFPFKKKLSLANFNLTYDEMPFDQICSGLGGTLYNLCLRGNRLSLIPEILTVKLIGLKILDISQCELGVIPDTWNLPLLKTLILSFNRLAVFPVESVFRGLPELQHLELQHNELTAITLPSDSQVITKLEYVDVSFNKVTALPVEIALFQSLKTLKCMNNLIEVIHVQICEMDLRVLDVSSNPLFQPPLETCERGLTSMRRFYHCLHLEENKKRDTHNTYISNLMKYEKNRVKMKMRKNKSFPFPLSMSSVSVLRSKSESISHTLPEAMVRRQTLSSSLTDGRQSLSSSLQGLENDTAVIASPDALGSDDSYSSPNDDFEEPWVINDTLKVIFVGAALSGKTSIINRLIDGKDGMIPHKDERTIGVDIYSWDPKTTDKSLMTQIPVDGELEKRIKSNIDVKFRVWDFAGQQVYHVSLYLFIRAGSCDIKSLKLLYFHGFFIPLHQSIRLLMNSFFQAKHCTCLSGTWARTNQRPIDHELRSRRKQSRVYLS